MTSPSLPVVDVAGARRLLKAIRSLFPSRSRDRFVLIGAALLVVIAAGDAMIVAMEREASYAAYETAGANLTRGMLAQTASKLGAVDKVLRNVTAALAIGHIADPIAMKAALRSRAAWEALADRQWRLPGVDFLGVVDADGLLANGSRAEPGGAIDFSGKDFFRGLKAGADESPFVSAPEQDVSSDGWRVYIARRVPGARGDFAGVALARLTLGDLEEFYRVALPPRRAITVMRDDGTVLVQYPRLVDRTGQIPPGMAGRDFGPSDCATYHGPDWVDETPVVAAICRMGSAPVVIETSAAEADALADWNQGRLWLAAGGVAASALVIGLLGLFARQVRRLEDSERSLERAHRQVDTALSNLSQGVCFFDADQRLVVANRRYCEVYGMPPDSVRPGDTLAEIIERRFKCVGASNYNGADYLARLQEIANTGTAHHTLVELSDGRTIAVQSQPMPDGGWVATHEDITERRAAEEKVAFLAKHDALTSLPNRSLLMERIASALKDVGRGKRFGILFLDLDRFKAVNDTLGHNAGDELLRNVATRLTGVVRHDCTVARLGGDEFVVLQVDVQTPEDCARLARRILKSLSAPYIIEEHEVVIGVSIGIDVSSPEAHSPDILLKHADLALYLSKSQGRGTFRFFEPRMDSRMRDRQQLEFDLRRAIEERQFLLHYQPVIEAASGEVCAFEALLRWNHPTRGMVGPGDFIALCEETGLIVPIGEWVIAEACGQAAQWPERIRIAVNVSPAQFRAVSLVPVIQEALASSGVAPARLEIEITESVLLQSNDRNLAILHQLRDLGVTIAMDDFGAGYSSISYLRKFPFDKIKIDQSFVRDLVTTPEAVYFVRAIVGLCRNLGIETTAEGVETADQLSILLDEECTHLQGYYFGRPSPAERADAFIARGGLIPSRPRRLAPPSIPERRMELAS